ncbi:vacuolar protein 14 C-terminal Fig4p binding-domain-containing protein [Syncephalis plumigaleata]|nr:vacuolar protein 14 C-terminal Fig4p binding-domain-containing protein [Syncephalis plumigaleata]
MVSLTTASTGERDNQDPFDYHATVSALTFQFINEHETTRVESLEWLLMLQRKAPHKILATDDGLFPVLLKILSDSSERVIQRDLQLLAQFSAYSDDTYFREFMVHLLRLFSSDRPMLENRGSLIIRQLCLSLNPERIYLAFAETLEKEEDLEFASIMVQNLNIILITSPEAAELRKRLKRMDIKENQTLFVALYRSWCHNSVATFSLCLLAQTYEHAANMLQIFAELDISVSFLIQLDKLVQLLESPLLEPERHPYLFKCLYGILMLLPQSSAFAILRNRLNSVGPFNISSASTAKSATDLMKRQKTASENTLRFGELLSHFRAVQLKHEEVFNQGIHGNGINSSNAATKPLPSQGRRRARTPSTSQSGRGSGMNNELDRARHLQSSSISGGSTRGAGTISPTGARPVRRIGGSTGGSSRR